MAEQKTENKVLTLVKEALPKGSKQIAGTTVISAISSAITFLIGIGVGKKKKKSN